jgi:hypothetical protein
MLVFFSDYVLMGRVPVFGALESHCLFCTVPVGSKIVHSQS